MARAAQQNSHGPLGAVFRIVPGVQSYDWGILGKDGSAVSKYAFGGAGVQDKLGVTYDENKPYAELWMGTHASCPSYTCGEGRQTLSDYLIEHPALLSQAVIDKYAIRLEKGQQGKSVLPFLLKILSAGKALSIQAHPDKQLAEKLHREKPDMYKDDNHKPEMAVALTSFRGFCGFRPLEEIAGFLEQVPEFRGIVDPSDELLRRLAGAEGKAVLKEVFAKLMKASEEAIKTWTTKLVDRIHAGKALRIEQEADIPMLITTLQEQFPNDIGMFCAYLLNHLRLQPGQALFLGANEPHAYLEGEIVECMAASDNVVRAGLTPKARDVDVLVSMLTYEYGPGERQFMQPSQWKGSSSGLTQLYAAPIPEFDVLRVAFADGKLEDKHEAVQGPSILIQTQGASEISWDGGSERLAEGAVVFIAPGVPITLKAEDARAVAFRAFVEAA